MNIVACVGFSLIFLLGVVIFKGFTARRLNKSFGVKGLICDQRKMMQHLPVERDHKRRTQPLAANMLESDVQCEEVFSGSKEAVVCLPCLELLGKINS
jgi:hypothetical protein